MRAAVALIVGGGCFIYFIARDWGDASRGLVEPRRMTCAELAAAEPEDNRHVLITHYVFSPRRIELTNSGDVWLSAVPTDDIRDSSATVIVRTNRGDVDKLLAAGEVRGMLKSRSAWDARDEEAVGMLTSDHVRLIGEGMHPTPLLGRIVLIGIGVAMIVWGIRILK